MEKRDRSKSLINLTQVLVWAFVILMPAFLSWSITGNNANALSVFKSTVSIMAPVLLLYLVNYFWLVPSFLFKDNRKKWFYAANAGLILLLNAKSFSRSLCRTKLGSRLRKASLSPSTTYGPYTWAWCSSAS